MEPPRNTFVMCFEAALEQEFKDRELTVRFRRSTEKISSSYAFVRQQGLREAVKQLSEMAMEMSSITLSGKSSLDEPAPRLRAADAARGAGVGDVATAHSTGEETTRGFDELPLAAGLSASMPYDAIRASVIPSAFTDPTSPSTPIRPDGGLAARGGSSAAAARPLNRNETWERVQRALGGCNCTSVVFDRIFLPRMALRSGAFGGGQLKVDLTPEQAENWTTLSAIENPVKTGDTAVASSNHLKEMLTEVSYAEQEMALRYLQGLCMVARSQCRNIAEGSFLPFAVECLLCCLQHIEALHRKRSERGGASRSATAPEADPMNSFTITDANGSSASLASSKKASTSCFDRGEGDSSGCAELRKGGPPHCGRDHDTSEAEVVEDSTPVPMHTGLEAVMVALLDVIEAACHYNPLCLNRFVQLGGVRAMLSLLYFPCTPVDLRCSVLDVVSVLMQEVAPFRRAVVQGPTSGAARDDLIKTMLHQALTGDYGTRSNPPSFLMDRASASKFDSAVREWFSQRGLSNVVTAAMELRDVRGTAVPPNTPRAELAKLIQRINQIREKRLASLLDAIDRNYARQMRDRKNSER